MTQPPAPQSGGGVAGKTITVILVAFLVLVVLPVAVCCSAGGLVGLLGSTPLSTPATPSPVP